MNLDDILKKVQSEKTASDNTVTDNSSVEKTAYEQGAAEAENMVKIAASLGDIIGNRVADVVEGRLAQSFGYDPEVVKQASLSDILDDAILSKYADQLAGSAANAPSTVLAEEQQIGEAAAHHATLAAASAADAVQSLHQGDEHTAVQQLATAGDSIANAKELAARVPANAAVAQHVEEAAAIVAQAADIAQQSAQAPAAEAAQEALQGVAQ